MILLSRLLPSCPRHRYHLSLVIEHTRPGYVGWIPLWIAQPIMAARLRQTACTVAASMPANLMLVNDKYREA
jgi:hypothetical protein